MLGKEIGCVDESEVEEHYSQAIRINSSHYCVKKAVQTTNDKMRGKFSAFLKLKQTRVNDCIELKCTFSNAANILNSARSYLIEVLKNRNNIFMFKTNCLNANIGATITVGDVLCVLNQQ